jgi:hypothetical protein
MSEPKDRKSEQQYAGTDSADESTSLEESSLAAINKNIEKKLEEAEISLPPEERKRVRMVVEQVIEKSEFFSGPQPSPELLEKYERRKV